MCRLWLRVGACSRGYRAQAPTTFSQICRLWLPALLTPQSTTTQADATIHDDTGCGVVLKSPRRSGARAAGGEDGVGGRSADLTGAGAPAGAVITHLRSPGGGRDLVAAGGTPRSALASPASLRHPHFAAPFPHFDKSIKEEEEEEEELFCSVCLNGDGFECNALIRCDLCGLAVHQVPRPDCSPLPSILAPDVQPSRVGLGWAGVRCAALTGGAGVRCAALTGGAGVRMRLCLMVGLGCADLLRGD